MIAHFVTFLSPGTFVSEQTELPIDSWDVAKACEMAHGITERHNATPYGFYFSTRARGDDDLDSKVTKRSGAYFLGGNVETIDQVEQRNDPTERILLSNMKCNGWNQIVVNTNSWKTTQPLRDGDVVLDWKKKASA
jgi:hypothetical protein